MNKAFGGIAQLGERLHGMQEVRSSILLVSTNLDSDPCGFSHMDFLCNKAPSFKIKEGASFPAALRVAFLFPDFLCNGFIKKKRGFAVCQGFMMAMDGNIEVREERCKARFSAYSFTGEVAQDEARRI